MVAEFLRHVGHHWIFDESIIGEREMLKSFHEKEQPGKNFKKNPTYLAPQCRCGFDTGTI
jgi:hypothetical protein